MKKLLEAIENVPSVNDIEGTVPVAMADAKKVSDERLRAIEKIMAKHRKETGAKEDKAFTGTKGDIMKGESNPELKKLDLNESLFESAGVREYTNKLLGLVDEGVIGKDFLITALVKYMSEDEVKEFCRMNDILFDEEDYDESLFEDTKLVEKLKDKEALIDELIEYMTSGYILVEEFIEGLLNFIPGQLLKNFLLKNGYYSEEDLKEKLLDGNTVNLNVDATGQSAAFLNGRSGDVINELLNDNTINLNLDASGSSVGFLGGTAGQVTNEAILNDDGEVYDMYYFLYGLFTDGGDDYRKPINPFGGRGKRKFDYNSKTVGHEIDLEMNTPVHSNRDGDIVLEAENPEAFDWAKKTCDFFQVDYEVKESNRAASKNRFKYEMVVFVPFDYEGNPATVEEYFAEIGLDPKDYIAKLDTGRNKVSGKFSNLSKNSEEKPA